MTADPGKALQALYTEAAEGKIDFGTQVFVAILKGGRETNRVKEIESWAKGLMIHTTDRGWSSVPVEAATQMSQERQAFFFDVRRKGIHVRLFAEFIMYINGTERKRNNIKRNRKPGMKRRGKEMKKQKREAQNEGSNNQ
jgi:hypothetical protein